eukprot:5101829-Pleurochrysis_carterae.AAC.1
MGGVRAHAICVRMDGARAHAKCMPRGVLSVRVSAHVSVPAASVFSRGGESTREPAWLRACITGVGA